MRYYIMPKPMGKTQLRIMDHLLFHNWVDHTWNIQRTVARSAAGYTKVVSRALDRLHKRGILKREYDPLTEEEAEWLYVARLRHPRASAFWIVSTENVKEAQAR
jgi:predicted transcriptional regulator